MNYATVKSPVGKIHLLGSDRGLCALYFDSQVEAMERRFPYPGRGGSPRSPWLLRAEAFIHCYFAGDLHFSPEIPLDLVGTPFQLSIWRGLQTILPGETRSYGELARALGRPRASRAVGAAVGRNPISIIIPCHRAVGSANQLTGYAGGLEIKRFLLKHEAKCSAVAAA